MHLHVTFVFLALALFANSIAAQRHGLTEGMRNENNKIAASRNVKAGGDCNGIEFVSATDNQLVERAVVETTSDESLSSSNNNATETILENEAEHADAVLFPSFCVTIGAVVYLALTRVKWLTNTLPYTAVCFTIGASIGAATLRRSSSDNILHDSVQIWTSIDAEVLLLVFLPGLIFRDAYGLNVHLLRVSLLQNIIFAVPLVLAGTTLTALVGYYMLPYGWSFNLCMTFGSILSATDPVAVAALLNELGAPPRLKIHISGEALLNDGSAIVFFSIFVLRFLYELGIAGVGEDVGVARGVALFFQKSLGGVAVGLFFGLAMLLMLKLHNRRFSREDSVSEVAAVLGLAYVGYFTSDYVWMTSGVIATLTAGVTVKYLGQALVNDEKLMDDFWSLLEHLLNTVLFHFGAVLFFAVYPLTRRIGLGTSIQETIFQIHGGLRGAVGIALALSLDSEVSHLTEGGQVDPIYREQTRQVFALVGGIAFMTLVINAPTCKPLLRYTKLSESSQSRKKIIDSFRADFQRLAVQDMVGLLTQSRFRFVNFAVIKCHVPFLRNLTKSQLMDAIEYHRDTTPTKDYNAPELGGIIPFIDNDMQTQDVAATDVLRGDAPMHQDRPKRTREYTSTLRIMMPEEPKNVLECRLLFLSMLRYAYQAQIASGELADREFLALALEQSLDLSNDHVAKGEPLNDWAFVNLVDPSIVKIGRKWKLQSAVCACLDRVYPNAHMRWMHARTRLNIDRALSFMAAHQFAQEYFHEEFSGVDNELTEAGKMVIVESKMQCSKAETALKKEDPSVVERVVSHKFCSILLSSSIAHIKALVEQGLLKDDEAEHWVQEVEKDLSIVDACTEAHGLGENGKRPTEEAGDCDIPAD
ncbi:hypothetical protein MPSEU_000927200 [Mayamaea pseudoterrestris]|nr:hypothetical protein MPSEU_000927200 [Mayamaea pseudoterrestris]